MTDQVVADRYRLVELLGRGGFGEVWKAFDLELGIEVALKRVKVDADGSATERGRATEAARAEARLAASLAFHPHVVAVTNVVVGEGDTPWLAMRYIRGRSLAEVLASGPLPPDQVARIADALFSALRAAHQIGITHRDVKPANIMLADDGGIFLTDFGIAKRRDETVTRLFTGSVGYAAPERFNHRDFGPPNGTAGDLFSVGATLYHAVEGRAPFAADLGVDSVGVVLHAVCYEGYAPPTRAGALRPLIEALLAKQAAMRPDVDQAVSMLQAAMGGMGGPPSAPGPAATSTRNAVPSHITLPSAGHVPGPAAAVSAGTASHKASPPSSDHRWRLSLPLAFTALLALTLILPATRYTSTPSNHYAPWTIDKTLLGYRLFFQKSGRPDWLESFGYLAGITTTLVATIRLHERSSVLIREAGYIGVPVAAVVYVNRLMHATGDEHGRAVLLPTSTTFQDAGVTTTETSAIGIGTWLAYVALAGLFVLYVCRTVSLRRRVLRG